MTDGYWYRDNHQRLCFTLGLWNGKDPILKERLYGLNGNQGNHGEDVKEVYYYLDSTPTHSYMKYLYKYPQAEFPYQQLKDENQNRSREVGEFELMDTDLFDENRYWDVYVEVSLLCSSWNFELWLTASKTKSMPKTKNSQTPFPSESQPTIAAPTLPTCTFFPKSSSATPGHGVKNFLPTCLLSLKKPKALSTLRTIPSVKPDYTVPLPQPLPLQQKEASSSSMGPVSSRTCCSQRMRQTLRDSGVGRIEPRL